MTVSVGVPLAGNAALVPDDLADEQLLGRVRRVAQRDSAMRRSSLQQRMVEPAQLLVGERQLEAIDAFEAGLQRCRRDRRRAAPPAPARRRWRRGIPARNVGAALMRTPCRSRGSRYGSCGNSQLRARRADARGSSMPLRSAIGRQMRGSP